jgi:hypothetical protein
MRHYLYRIYTDDGEEEVIVGADSIKEADWILSREEDIIHFSYLDELTDQEAEDSGLDEL